MELNKYVPPSCPVHRDWDRHKCDDFIPTERQRGVISAVQAALAANLYYTEDVRAFCAAALNVTDEQAQAGARQVQGGDFGMDCYYARSYLDGQKLQDAQREALARLKPVPGQQVGTLVFNDYKRNTNVVVVEVADGGKSIKLQGKRGAYTVTMSCSALQIANAVDRAAERGMRKDRFSDLTAQLVTKSEEAIPT